MLGLFLECVKKAKQLDRLEFHCLKLSYQQTCEVYQAILEMEALKTFSFLNTRRGANYTENESIELFMKIIDQATNLNLVCNME